MGSRSIPHTSTSWHLALPIRVDYRSVPRPLLAAGAWKAGVKCLVGLAVPSIQLRVRHMVNAQPGLQEDMER